jgi:hypothetical protein
LIECHDPVAGGEEGISLELPVAAETVVTVDQQKRAALALVVVDDPHSVRSCHREVGAWHKGFLSGRVREVPAAFTARSPHRTTVFRAFIRNHLLQSNPKRLPYDTWRNGIGLPGAVADGCDK